jgi:hypothetical protein
MRLIPRCKIEIGDKVHLQAVQFLAEGMKVVNQPDQCSSTGQVGLDMLLRKRGCGPRVK